MNDITYRRNAQTDTSVVGERIIVFERASKCAIVLNPTGADIWNSLETPRSVAQLKSGLQARFPGVEAAQLERDVEAYLQELLGQNLIERA